MRFHAPIGAGSLPQRSWMTLVWCFCKCVSHISQYYVGCAARYLFQDWQIESVLCILRVGYQSICPIERARLLQQWVRCRPHERNHSCKSETNRGKSPAISQTTYKSSRHRNIFWIISICIYISFWTIGSNALNWNESFHEREILWSVFT